MTASNSHNHVCSGLVTASNDQQSPFDIHYNKPAAAIVNSYTWWSYSDVKKKYNCKHASFSFGLENLDIEAGNHNNR